MKRRFILFGLVAVPVAALVAVALTLAMAFALDGEVAGLQRQLRGAARLERELHADIAAVGKDLAALQAVPAAASAAEPPAAAAPAAAASLSGLTHLPYAIDSPRMVKVNAVAAADGSLPLECVFKSGDSERLTDCIRSQQDQLAARAQRRYR